MTTANHSKQPRHPSDKGAVLVVVLVVMVALLGLGMTGLFLTSGSIQMSTNINQRNQALVVAEAGIERARQVLNSPVWVPPIQAILTGSNPGTGDEIPTLVTQCEGEMRGALLVDTTSNSQDQVGTAGTNCNSNPAVPCVLQGVRYPNSVNRTAALANGGTILNPFIGQYTVYVRQDQSDCRLGNFTCDNAPDLSTTPTAPCTAPPGVPAPNGLIVVRSEGLSADNRTRVVLEVTMSPGSGSAVPTNTPLSSLCAAGARGCDDNTSVQNGIVVNSPIAQNNPPAQGGSNAGGAGGAGGTGAGGITAPGVGGAIATGGSATGGSAGAGGSGAGGAGGTCGHNTEPLASIGDFLNAMILLDRSWSMARPLIGDNINPPTPLSSPPINDYRAWAAMSVIRTVVQKTENVLSWGLMEFPGHTTCAPPSSTTPIVAPGAPNYANISSALTGTISTMVFSGGSLPSDCPNPNTSDNCTTYGGSAGNNFACFLCGGYDYDDSIVGADPPAAGYTKQNAGGTWIQTSKRGRTPVVWQYLGSAFKPFGAGTPTGDAIWSAQTYLKTSAPGRTSYIIIATDGDATCNNSPHYPPASYTPSAGAIQAVKDAMTPDATGASVHTFVVGMALSNVSAAAQVTLNGMAQQGGQVCQLAGSGGPCAHSYYAADNFTDLYNNLGTIAATAIPCNFRLKELPATPSAYGDVSVQRYINGVAQPAEKSTGGHWGWTTTSKANDTLQLQGSWCSDLQHDLGPMAYKFTIDFGCTAPVANP